jgi:purine-binding chemotaxis protein CheW
MEAAASANPRSGNPAQFLTFLIAGEEYGTVVPVVDMRKRFGMNGADFGPTTVVIVVKLSQHGVDRRVGLVVDAVSEVYQFADDAIQPTPDLVSGTRADFVTGLATVDKKMVILLTVDKLVSFDTAGAVALEAATVH